MVESLISNTRFLMSEEHSEAYAASKGGIVALTHALAISVRLKILLLMLLVQAGLNTRIIVL